MPSDKRNGGGAAPHKNDHKNDKNYRPSDKEPFMNERQREYFRQSCSIWKDEILREAKETLAHLQTENENHPDLADRASSETDRAIELRARDRQRKLIAKIEEALVAPRRRQLRLLRGNRRADLAQAARGTPDRDALGRGAGAPRAARAHLPGRVTTRRRGWSGRWSGRLHCDIDGVDKAAPGAQRGRA